MRCCYMCCQVLLKFDIQSIIAVQCRALTLSCIAYNISALLSITQALPSQQLELEALPELQFEEEPHPLDLIH